MKDIYHNGTNLMQQSEKKVSSERLMSSTAEKNFNALHHTMMKQI